MRFSSLLGHTRELFQLVQASDQPADSVVDSFFRSRGYLGSHDRRFIADTVYGTLRHLRRCDVVLQRAMRGNERSVPPEDGFLLLVAAFLLLIDRRTPVFDRDLFPLLKSPQFYADLRDLLLKLPSEAAVEECDPIERIGIQYSFPRWMVERMVSQYGQEQCEKICASLNEQAPLTLRVNTLKTSVKECQQLLAAEGIETKRTLLSPVGLEVPKRINIFELQAFQQGLFEVQDEGSQLLPLLVDPKPATKLLDACAGAGGKTLQFAALMENLGKIVATDIVVSRLDELRRRARRTGISNVHIKVVRDLSDLSEEYSAYFDDVFVDAPCSGLGTIRRNPGIKWKVTEESVRQLSAKQLHILNACAPLVKPEGRLFYATCTLLREENEDVIDAFLEGRRDFALMDHAGAFSQLTSRFSHSKRHITLLPHLSGTDGFFCAVLGRVKQ